MTVFPAHVFREYDIRGDAERDLSDEVVSAIGRALAEQLAPEGRAPRLALGRDCRQSSPRLYTALLQGLVDGGADVTSIGVGPTPLLYFAVHHLDADGGVMITGSHNPPGDNGFKIMRGRASFFGQDLQRLSAVVKKGVFSPPRRGSLQNTTVDDDYVHRLRDSVSIDDPSFGVVVDAGNGAAGPIGLRALRATGVNPTALYCEMDGAFPNHHPDPTVPENLTALIDTVRSTGARVGIAWDGDGDRLGVVDATGEIVWGDRLLTLFARDILRTRPGAAILGEVKCSQTLFDDVAARGGRPIMWKTGHSLIKTKMKEEQALLAGEMSGHFFFADRYYGYDDGIYAALRLLEILAREKKTLGELLSDLPVTFGTPELRVACPDDAKLRVVERVRDAFRGRGHLVEIDGVRVTFEDGAWALVRASNTGPVLVLRVEAPSQARRDALRDEVRALVRQAGADA